MSTPIRLQDGTWSGVLNYYGTNRQFSIEVRANGPHKGSLSAAYFVEAQTLVLAFESSADQIVTGIRSLSFEGTNHLEFAE